jgi:cytochrome c-type biogenesis protein CcmH
MIRWFGIMLLLFSTAIHARIETHAFNSPEDEARYQQLTEELRCLVCQNQNLADSNAELAQDLRNQTYEMVQAGKSNEEIVAYMVQRYGDFVLYRPPLRPATFLLWGGPFLILAIGVIILLAFIRRRTKEQAPGLSPEEVARAESLLNNTQDKNPS